MGHDLKAEYVAFMAAHGVPTGPKPPCVCNLPTCICDHLRDPAWRAAFNRPIAEDATKPPTETFHIAFAAADKAVPHVSSLCVCGQPLNKHEVDGQYDGGCFESGCGGFERAKRGVK
jgi:hypothetical protein